MSDNSWQPPSGPSGPSGPSEGDDTGTDQTEDLDDTPGPSSSQQRPGTGSSSPYGPDSATLWRRQPSEPVSREPENLWWDRPAGRQEPRPPAPPTSHTPPPSPTQSGQPGSSGTQPTGS